MTSNKPEGCICICTYNNHSYSPTVPNHLLTLVLDFILSRQSPTPRNKIKLKTSSAQHSSAPPRSQAFMTLAFHETYNGYTDPLLQPLLYQLISPDLAPAPLALAAPPKSDVLFSCTSRRVHPFRSIWEGWRWRAIYCWRRKRSKRLWLRLEVMSEAQDYRSIETHIRWVWARLSAASARFMLGLRRWKLRKVIVMMRMTIANSRITIMMSTMMEKKVIKMRRFMKSENNKSSNWDNVSMSAVYGCQFGLLILAVVLRLFLFASWVLECSVWSHSKVSQTQLSK